MSLLDLPTELLDEVFSYLDWDRSQLYPTKTDVVNASVTCKHLRKALIPLVFRDVTLRLQWMGIGSLARPSLLKLRVRCPELMEHVRSVFIKADFTHYSNSTEGEELVPFELPLETENWLTLASETRHHQTVRERILDIAHETYETWKITEESELTHHGTAEATILNAIRLVDGQYARDELTALGLVMLCVPSSIHNLIIKTLPDGDVADTRNRFALCVAAQALSLFYDKVDDLTVVTNDAGAFSHLHHQQQQRNASNIGIYGTRWLTADSLHKLNILRLTLASKDKLKYNAGRESRRCQNLTRWHGVSHRLRELDLRYMCVIDRDLLAFIKGFTSLESLSLHKIQLSMPHIPGNTGRADLERRIWLGFVIELRRSMKRLDISLSSLYSRVVLEPLPVHAETWLLHAIPAGSMVDVDRETRLLEDFDSFMPLWTAESSVRGASARDEWTRTGASLCDLAMSRRWR